MTRQTISKPRRRDARQPVEQQHDAHEVAVPERVRHREERRGRVEPRDDVVGAAGAQAELAHDRRADHHDEDREHEPTPASTPAAS